MVPLIVESDCLNIVQAVQSDTLDLSELGVLLDDLRQLLINCSFCCFFDSCMPLWNLVFITDLLSFSM
jgi:hypothetical protein